MIISINHSSLSTSRFIFQVTVTMYSRLIVCLFWSLFYLSVGTHSSNDGKFPLHFGYITTKTGDFIASGGIPIVDLALQIINERDGILQNYTLKYTDVLDSGVSVF